MHAFFSIAAASFLAVAVRSAPVGTSLDATVFLQNAQEAQALNTKFLSLNSTDTCKDGQLACIDNSIAHCENSEWSLEPCTQSLSCFAMPSLRESGVVVSCTTNATAAAIIEASGATGGVFSNSTSHSVKLPFDCNGDDESDSSSSNNSTASSASLSATATTQSQSTVIDASSTLITNSASATATSTRADEGAASTVTVTVVATGTITFPSETTTLNRSQASSFLSSIATESGVSITTVGVPASSSSSLDASVTGTVISTGIPSTPESSATTQSTSIFFSSASTGAAASATFTESAVSGFSSVPPIDIGSASSTSAASSVAAVSAAAPTTIILGGARATSATSV